MEKRNIYKGHRYVPKIMGEWNQEETYEGLSIVTNKGRSFTSKKRVPVGIDILDEEYWVVTGNYNAQIEHYRQDIKDHKEQVEAYKQETTKQVEGLSENFTTQVEGLSENFTTQVEGLSENFTTQVEGLSENFTTQLEHVDSKLVLNISDFPRLDGETTDDGRFTRALNSFDKGALQLGAKKYTITDPIIVKDYQQLNGIYGVTEINLIGGGDTSNNSLIKVATGRDMFWVSITNLNLTYHGSRTDVVGIDLTNSNHLNLENIYIKGAFYKGIIGSVWLANISNVTAWCDYDFGHTAFDFKDGTSVNMSTVWSKNFARGFNLGSVLYSSLDSCAVDTFSVYAYTGGQGISYNGCGAEDGRLVKGGYIWGNRYRSAGLIGCQIMNIGVSTGVLKGETSIFHSLGASISITNFRQQTAFNVSDMIDVIHALEDSKVTIENSQIMGNYNEFVKMNSEWGEVSVISGHSETVYNLDKKKQVTLRIGNQFFEGFKKVSNTLAEGSSFNDSKNFFASHRAHRNTHMIYTGGSAKTIDILSCKTDSTGSFSVNINLDISVVTYGNTASLVKSHSIKGIARSVNGTKQVDPIIIISGNESHGITVSWSGDTLKVTLNDLYAHCFIETTVSQAISTGKSIMEWL